MSPYSTRPATPDPLRTQDFKAFYKALYGYQPFQWQERLAVLACVGQWPDYIKLPTASGKTATVDIAIFSLAYQAAEVNRPNGIMTAARRIFFVVDRRIIVNEAYRRALDVAKKLRRILLPDADQNNCGDPSSYLVLARVARWLQCLTGDEQSPPLDCFELRGGIYRDDAWVRSPLQPTVLTSTVDQVGSRLLFRGYGVSSRNWPIHAALTSNDSLIILDEAHCSKPFSQTMASIKRYRSERWTKQSIVTPFSFVQMTATPPGRLDKDKLFHLDPSDYEADNLLNQRHGCNKPVELVLASGAKGKNLNAKLSKKLAEEATKLATKYGIGKIAVVVNRVALARATFDALNAKHDGRVSLMIGRMRPIDRDDLTKELHQEYGAGWTKRQPETSHSEPKFVVATQCLEVGADLDFQGMVSQCASMDALRQRFGRLNRLGEFTNARGVIVAAAGDLQELDKLNDEKPIDPIYGNALARTWDWLQRNASTEQTDGNEQDCASVLDFGIKTLDAICSAGDVDTVNLLAPSDDAPVLMPSHIDMLCQTAPRPTPEPEIAAYLHGPNRGCPEVRVCWRADLDVSELTSDGDILFTPWLRAVEVCPPSSAECLSVPLHLFRKWLGGQKVVDDTSDVLSETVEEGRDEPVGSKPIRRVLVWLGKRRNSDHTKHSFCASHSEARRIRPNDTIVIPTELGGWMSFGYVPNAPPEPTESAEQLHATALLQYENSDDRQDVGVANKLANIDVADRAFLQSRAQTIFRVHRKLKVGDDLTTLFKELLLEEKNVEADLDFERWQVRANELLYSQSLYQKNNSENHDKLLSPLERLSNSTKGKIVRYPDGLAWITERHSDMKHFMLPLPSFGDDRDELSLTGDDRISLKQHLADVLHATKKLVEGLRVSVPLSEGLMAAAKLHDIGKVDARFQAMLLNQSLTMTFMQRTLWAKSDKDTWNYSASELPEYFRHEMLSLSLLDYFEVAGPKIDIELVKHQIASHHGHARPFAPVCRDDAPIGLNLTSFGFGTISSEQRAHWQFAHRLDSGIGYRFWRMNRKYGWWGLAYLETLLRLADWSASANPGRGDEQEITHSWRGNRLEAKSVKSREPLVLSGIDGSNPLAFLAALGLFRLISESSPSSGFRMAWTKHHGAWRPAISSSTDSNLIEERILDLLEAHLRSEPAEHPVLRLAEVLEDADNPSKRREVFASTAKSSRLDDRTDADWLSCNGSDIADPDSISQLQTTRRDYHARNIRGLANETTREHIQRSLFEPWDYSDPIAGVSLHLEPREDRRHAYQWHTPSGDPTRKHYGGMIGANRLALEAWPLFQSLPDKERLNTVGFCGTKANDIRFSWPIWDTPIPLVVLPSVLALGKLQQNDIVHQRQLAEMGIQAVFRCNRILVGKTPNLTMPVPILT